MIFDCVYKQNQYENLTMSSFSLIPMYKSEYFEPYLMKYVNGEHLQHFILADVYDDSNLITAQLRFHDRFTTELMIDLDLAAIAFDIVH